MQHAFRGSRRLFAFFSTCALISFAVFAASGLGARPGQEGPSSPRPSPRQRRVTITSQPWDASSSDPPGVNLYTLTQLARDEGQHHQLRRCRPVDLGSGQQGRDQGRRAGLLAALRTTSTTSPRARPALRGRCPADRATRTSAPSSAATPTGSPTRRSSSTAQTYTLDANNGVNTLHGGFLGWNTAVWTATTSTGPGSVALQLTKHVPGRRGLPGAAEPGLQRVPGDR